MQERFPGIGNWMADEVLWRAGFHPQAKAGSFGPKSVRKLHATLREVCAEAMEVIGKGTVTLVDPSQMQSNVAELETLEQIEMLGVQLHVLPAGHRYSLKALAKTSSSVSFRRAIQRLVAVGPIRG